jgi:hypothetical protein
MEKQEFRSKWDELARELGAEISPETEQREQARSTPPAGETPPVEIAAKSATIGTSPKRSSADWDKLAGDLGLPPADAPPQPPEQPADEDRPPAPRSQSSHRAQDERPPRETRQHPSQRERRETRSESQPRQRHAGKSRERRPARQPEREDEPVPDAPVPPPAKQVDPTAKPAAVSLWHKIFGSPAEQSAKLADTSASSESESVQALEESLGIADSTIRSLSGSDVTAASFVEGGELADEPAADERRRGRPRRRRRGGRGRRSDTRATRKAPASTDEEHQQEALEIADEFEDLNVPDSIDDESDSASFDDTFAADETSNGASLDGSDSDGSKVAQKTIPTWEEAIGFIVDCNMQSRSQRRPPSRGTGSRGRSRGRRKS